MSKIKKTLLNKNIQKIVLQSTLTCIVLAIGSGSGINLHQIFEEPVRNAFQYYIGR